MAARSGTLPKSQELGRAMRLDDAGGRYIEFVKNSFPKGLTLDGLKIVVDCAHGAAYRVAPAVLRELGANVIAIGVEPDGMNINRETGPPRRRPCARRCWPMAPISESRWTAMRTG